VWKFLLHCHVNQPLAGVALPLCHFIAFRASIIIGIAFDGFEDNPIDPSDNARVDALFTVRAPDQKHATKAHFGQPPPFFTPFAIFASLNPSFYFLQQQKARAEFPERTLEMTLAIYLHLFTALYLILFRGLSQELNPFAESGSARAAAIHSGFHYLSIEQDAKYIAIDKARIAHALTLHQEFPVIS
jgi:hypothetical protein